MKHKWILTSSILALALLLTMPCAPAQSRVPSSMAYRGLISDENGNLVGLSTPVNRKVIFRIWDSPTATAPVNLLYSEEHIVTIGNGEFVALVGEGAQLDPGPRLGIDSVFDGAELDGAELFLGVTVDDGDGNLANDPEIMPRQQLVTSAFAFRAQTAEGVPHKAITSAMLATGAVRFDSFARDAITVDELKDFTLTVNNFDRSAITELKLANRAVTSGKIAKDAITLDKIPMDFIESTRIKNRSINTEDLADGSVTLAKMPGSVGLWTASGANFYHNSGNVGIGTNTPEAKLDVVGGNEIPTQRNLLQLKVTPRSNGDDEFFSYWGVDIETSRPPGGRNFVVDLVQNANQTLLAADWDTLFGQSFGGREQLLYANLGVRSDWFIASGRGFVSYSDRRIKRDIRRSDTASDLAAIEKLQVSDYRMVDPADGGVAWRKGFIAQEVEKVIPGAITLNREFIPDIFSLATATVYDPGTRSLSLNLEQDYNLKVGERVRLHVDGKRFDLRVTAVPSQREFKVGDCESAPDKVFVYGRQVNDFRTVNYDHIFTTSVGALQELKKKKDAQVKSLRDETSALRNRMVALEADHKVRDTKLDDLEKLVLSIKPPEISTVSLKTGE